MTDSQQMLLIGVVAVVAGIVGLLGGDNWWNPMRLKRSIRDRVSPGFSRKFTKGLSIFFLAVGALLAIVGGLMEAGIEP